MPGSSSRRSYRRRVKRSMCKGRKRRTCKKIRGCKWYKGRTRSKSMCRKQHNKHRSNYRRRTRRMRGGGADLNSLF